MIIHTIGELKKTIGQIFKGKGDIERTIPDEIIFNRGIEYTKYKITIQIVEEDFFVDSKGNKWQKVKDTTKKETPSDQMKSTQIEAK